MIPVWLLARMQQVVDQINATLPEGQYVEYEQEEQEELR